MSTTEVTCGLGHTAQLVSCLLSICKVPPPRGGGGPPSPASHKSDMATQLCNPSSQEAEAGESEVQGYSPTPEESEFRLGGNKREKMEEEE